MGAFGGEGSSAVGLDRLVARMEREEFDLIAVGRALLSDARWAEKIHRSATGELRDFDAAALRRLD
jgi:2,4-dienoyl-CoA reductase-like NADH-dependent reductase (Old Yellow Enzyme family)